MKGVFLSYKGISAFAQYYPDENIYHGTIPNLKDLVTFGGETVEEVTQDFKDAVEDYLSDESYNFDGVSLFSFDMVTA